MKRTLLLLFILSINVVLFAQSKTLNVTTAGSLSTLLTTAENSSLIELTLTGNIDARDFKHIRDNMPMLEILNVSGVSIKAYNGANGTNTTSTNYPANELPINSFYNGVTNLSKTTLRSLTLPTSLRTIASNAVRGCSNLVGTLTLPVGVTSIAGYAFNGCTGIKIINSLNATPPSIVSTTFSTPSVVYVPSSGLVAYKAAAVWSGYTISSEKRVTIYNPTAGSLAVTIINAGYSPLSSITHLTVTGNINDIDISQIKSSMTTLTELDLSGVVIVNNTLADNAFLNKTTLSVVKLPETLTTIGASAFSGCSALSCDIPVPSSVTSIGNNAFYNCIALVGSLNISNVTTLGTSVFYGCKSLNGSLTLPNSVASIGQSVFDGCSGLTGELKIPATVATIGTYAFRNCSRLTGSLVLPSAMTTISGYAFSGCSGLSGQLVLHNSITSVGGYAFAGCTSLTDLNIGKNVATLSDYAFNNATGLRNIIVGRTAPATIYASTFAGVNKELCALKVPTGSFQLYQADAYWREFIFMSEISFIDAYGLTVKTGTGGSVYDGNTLISNNSIMNVNSGTSKTFRFTYTTGYEIDQILFNGQRVEDQVVSNQYTTPAIDANATITISFRKIRYMIQIKSAENGTVNLQADYGSQPAFTFTPSAGWQFHSLLYNGVDVSSSISGGYYTLPAVTKSGSLSVVYELATPVGSLSSSPVRVYTQLDNIVVDGTSPGEIIELYTVDGVRLSVVKSSSDRVFLKARSGVTYIVRTKNKMIKLVL